MYNLHLTTIFSDYAEFKTFDYYIFYQKQYVSTLEQLLCCNNNMHNIQNMNILQ